MLAHTSNTRNIMNSNISLEEQRPRESMALLFAQETRWAVLEKVNQYTRLVCFVLQCLQAVREPSLAIESLYPGEQPFKLRLDITDLPPYRSDVISTNCWPTCTAAQLQGSFSPFHLRRLSTFYAGISYVYFALFLPTLVSLPIARSLPTIAFIARNDFFTQPFLFWIACESFDEIPRIYIAHLTFGSKDERRGEENGILISIFARGRVVARDMLMRDQIIADGMELKYLGRLNVIVETFVYHISGKTNENWNAIFNRAFENSPFNAFLVKFNRFRYFFLNDTVCSFI